MIAWDLLILLQPPLICGTLFGVLLNFTFPEWLVLILLFALLMYGLYTTLSRTIHLLKKETEQKQAEQAKGEAIQTELHVLTPSEPDNSDKLPRPEDESDNEPSLREEEEPEVKEVPLKGQASLEVVLKVEDMTPGRAFGDDSLETWLDHPSHPRLHDHRYFDQRWYGG
jgi:hypothetical protein